MIVRVYAIASALDVLCLLIGNHVGPPEKRTFGTKPTTEEQILHVGNFPLLRLQKL